MKNLTRILALVLVFTMMVSSAAFAAKFTDVAEDSTYAEAVEVLSSLGIINGYEDGTFKPDAVITRAEVVAIVNRLQGLSDAAKAAAGTSMYTDVATSDWFAGDVNLASQMGIVSGDGNGLFRPNDQVKYEEAVKMMVAALGYNQEYVLKQGGWPTGYLVIATDKGVTKGLAVSAGEPAHRGVVAKLAYQSLTAPMMVLSTYDDEGKATYAADEAKTLLGTKLGFAKVVGYVSANATSSITDATGTNDAEIVKYVVNTTAKVGKDNKGYKYYVGNTDVADFADNNAAATANIKVGATDVASALGLATEVYIGSNEDGDAEVLTYIVSKKNNATALIEKTSDIQTSGKYASTYVVDGNTFDGILSVYDDEVDTTNTEYKLDKANIIYNGSWVNAATFTFPSMAQAELLDNDGDGKYEFVYVTEFVTKVVDSVYGANKKIGMKLGSTIDLTNFIEEKEGYTYSISLDGEEIDITDLQEYDVLSVAESANGKSIVIIVSRNVVEGAVESIDPNANPFKQVYQIAGAEYTVGNVGAGNIPSITSSTEGKFYVDAFGKIAMTEADTAISGSLAFIQGIGDYTSMGQVEYEVEVLNKDGSVEIYNLADNVTVKENATLIGKEGKAAVAARITALMGTNSAAAFAKRLVSYKANASGKITAISFVDTLAKEGLSFAAGSAADEYDASVSSLAYGVTDSTVIFYLPIKNGQVDKDDFKVTDISMLVDEKTYDTAYLDIDKDLNAGVMVIASESISIGEESALALVTGSVISTNEEGDRVITVSFLQNGEEKTLSVDSEAAVNDVDNNPFVRGAAFEYSVNAEGDIDDAKFCGPVNTIALTPAQVEAAAIAGNVFATVKADNLDYQYIAGYVVAKNGSTLTLNASYAVEGGAKVAIPSTANVYVMDVTKSKIIPQVAAIGDVTKVQYYNGNLEENQDTYVIIKYIDKQIVDVIAYYGLNF